MNLSEFTPITQAAYNLLVGHSFEGQTSVQHNHNWTCWKTADGQLVRVQSQLVPDSLLTPVTLAESNAEKHDFLRPFTELGQSFDVQIPEIKYGRAAQLLTFEYRKSDTGNEYYDLLLDGKSFDGVFSKQPENIVTGLVGQFGYKLGDLLPLLPEVLHPFILRRIGVWVSSGVYQLMDRDYTGLLKWNADQHEMLGHKFGYPSYHKLITAGFTRTRAVSAAVFNGSLIGMDQDERTELLAIVELQPVQTDEQIREAYHTLCERERASDPKMPWNQPAN